MNNGNGIIFLPSLPHKKTIVLFSTKFADSFVRQDTLLGTRAKNPRRIQSHSIDQNTCMCPVQIKNKNMHVNTMAITYTVSDPDLLRTHASLDMPSLRRPKAGMWGSSESPQIQG